MEDSYAVITYVNYQSLFRGYIFRRYLSPLLQDGSISVRIRLPTKFASESVVVSRRLQCWEPMKARHTPRISWLCDSHLLHCKKCPSQDRGTSTKETESAKDHCWANPERSHHLGSGHHRCLNAISMSFFSLCPELDLSPCSGCFLCTLLTPSRHGPLYH